MTREAEWDDQEREKMLALTEFEAHICGCGLHESVADEDPDLEITLRRCPVCAGMARATRQLHARDEEELAMLGEKPAPEAERPDDGRRIGLKFKVAD